MNGLQTFEQNNTLGSAVALRDSSGALLRQDEFDAFGIGSTLSGTYTRPWQWGGAHGYVTDGQSGLVLCGARYYIPAIGRWLTQDPKGHNAGLDLYEYCQNNPLRLWDPAGTDPQGWWSRQWDNLRGWANGLDAAFGFVTGTGRTENYYGPSSLQSRQMEGSAGASFILQAVLAPLAE